MKYTIILLLLLPNLCLGQDSVTIEGKVLDAENREPISYANIGFPSVNIGTASQRDGTFKLKLPKDLKDDSLQISAIGYNTDKVHVSTFLDNERVRFKLTPKTYQLESITVTDRKKSKWIGKKIPPIMGSASYGFRTHPERLGAAFAFRVTWDKNLPIKILHSRILLKRASNDSLKIRCGIAKVDPETKLPANEFVNNRVVNIAEKEKGWMTCNFDRENVFIDESEFFIVFEWLNKEDERIVPMIATGLFFKSDSYIRHHALAKWEKSSANNLIYSVKVEY